MRSIPMRMIPMAGAVAMVVAGLEEQRAAVIEELPEVQDQGQLHSSVGHATATAVEAGRMTEAEAMALNDAEYRRRYGHYTEARLTGAPKEVAPVQRGDVIAEAQAKRARKAAKRLREAGRRNA